MSTAIAEPLAPGGSIGILGGGQLGRMTCLAAQQLGYNCHVFCPEANAPAAQVTAFSTLAPYNDYEALAAFAAKVDLVTFEFENIPSETAAFLAARRPLRPRLGVLEICQDRMLEKEFCRDIGVATTPFARVVDAEALAQALSRLGRPAVLKTNRLGYDGKGQVLLSEASDPAGAWQEMTGGMPEVVGVLEAFVDFRMELSVIVARSTAGAIESYVPVENRHKNHILDETIAPAGISPALAERAEAIARHIAEKIDLVGLMAVEMFLDREDQILVNELAPRPHNSGHWTIDACNTSQFEQFVRAIAGLPLGAAERQSDAVMKNLLGDEVESWLAILQDPRAKLHLYGKTDARPGRKMGHVTRLIPRST